MQDTLISYETAELAKGKGVELKLFGRHDIINKSK